jgi:3-methylcrotonyl-CoA carboxylase alpha subunit
MIRAPMNGIVAAVSVEAGAVVEKGAQLVVLEAMKMEHGLRAPAAGIVEHVLVRVGEQVATRQILVQLKPNEDQA